MSNFLAIATVTETLRRLLDDVLKASDSGLTGAGATAVRPSGLNNTGTGAGLPPVGVNVFLYQVMPNPGGRNLDLPTRRSDGSAIQRPRAAIDLHYMFSVYGAESSLEPQRVMGLVVRTLHSHPILTRDAIDHAALGLSYLATSDLSRDVETVKMSPLALTLDEMSRVWSVYFQTSYALSICYQASTLFVEDTTPINAPLPVRTPNIVSVPMDLPVIDSIAPQPAYLGDTVTIRGLNVGRRIPFVAIGDGDPLKAKVIGPNEIQLPIPATMEAGSSPVRVVQKIDFGTASLSEPHDGFQSNVAALALAPKVVSTDPTVAVGGTLKVTVDVSVAPEQRVAIVLGQRVLPLDLRPVGSAPITDLTIKIPGDLMPGSMLVRVRIDGVDSPLTIDDVPASPTYRKAIAPKVTVT